MKTSKKSGFTAVIGLPNVGKSTLVNALVGKKISIISRVPQTTRNLIRGILTTKTAQIVFVDSPGYHRQKYKFNRELNKMISNILLDVDTAVFMVSSIDKENETILKLLGSCTKLPVILAVNKTDILKNTADDVMSYYGSLYSFVDSLKISALRKQGLEELTKSIIGVLPYGPFYYPPGQKTDRDDYFIFSEIVREKLFYALKQEMPHKIMVTADAIDYNEDKQMYFMQFVVWVEKDSEKAILIGKGGEFMKNIGTKSRKDIESILNKRVFLGISVRTKEKWRNDSRFISNALHYEKDILLT